MHPSYNVLEEIIYENEDFKNKLMIEPIIEAFIMSKNILLVFNEKQYKLFEYFI